MGFGVWFFVYSLFILLLLWKSRWKPIHVKWDGKKRINGSREFVLSSEREKHVCLSSV
jgi:hypothetical protein